MSLTSYEGRNLPSVFSDIPSRNEVQDARRRMGRLGMWIFLLIGAVIVAGVIAGGAYYLYQQKNAQLADLQGAYNDLEQETTSYEDITRLRGSIEGSRRSLLDRLEGVNGAPRLNARQREEGWKAARAALFSGIPGAPRERNEPSQTWPDARNGAFNTMQTEVGILASADRAVRVAHARYASTPGTGGGNNNCPGGVLNCR